MSDDKVPPKVLALRDEALHVLAGDWRSDGFEFMCDGQCGGDETVCVGLAVQRIKALLIRLIFSKKMTIPVVSRWWKVGPAVREVLLGCACHRVLGGLAPARWYDNRKEGAVDDHHQGPVEQWALEHGYRVRRTYAFFTSPATIPDLAIYLTVIQIQHHIMAWLMLHDNLLGPGGCFATIHDS